MVVCLQGDGPGGVYGGGAHSSLRRRLRGHTATHPSSIEEEGSRLWRRASYSHPRTSRTEDFRDFSGERQFPQHPSSRTERLQGAEIRDPASPAVTLPRITTGAGRGAG
jgi:hypothetical protein